MSNKVDANPAGGDDQGNTGKSGDANRPGDATNSAGGKSRGERDEAEHGRHRPGHGSTPNDEPATPGGAWYVVDRVEEGYVVLIAEAGGATVEEPAGNLPSDAGEGSCVLRRDDGSFIADHARTAERHAHARARLRALRDRSRRHR